MSEAQLIPSMLVGDSNEEDPVKLCQIPDAQKLGENKCYLKPLCLGVIG